MNCKKCGEEIPENGTFCEFCGAKVFEKEPPKYNRSPQDIIVPQGYKKTNRRVLWLILALVLLIGTTIVAYKLVHRAHVSSDNANNVSYLEKSYDDALEEFDRKCNFIPIDPEGEVGNKGHIIEALSALQAIEQCEKDPLFSKLGRKFVFGDKLEQYRNALTQTRDDIYNNNKKAFARGDDDPYVNKMADRLKYIEYILEQLNDDSVLGVQKRPTFE